jgi:hypothetical protein
VAPWAFFPIAPDVMIKTRQNTAVVASRWISDENSVMVLSALRRLFLMLFLPSVWNWIKIAVNGCYGKLDAPVRFMHLEIAILADGQFQFLIAG